jgi:hypothetical protein
MGFRDLKTTSVEPGSHRSVTAAMQHSVAAFFILKKQKTQKTNKNNIRSIKQHSL